MIRPQPAFCGSFQNLGSGAGLQHGQPGPRNRPQAVPEIVPQHAFHNDRTESAWYGNRPWRGAPYRGPFR